MMHDVHKQRTCIITEFLQSFCQFDLSLYLSPQLLHLPEVLHHLSPHYLDDGGREGETQEDVDRAYHHVKGFVCKSHSIKINIIHILNPTFPCNAGRHVPEAYGGGGDKTEIESIEECPVCT